MLQSIDATIVIGFHTRIKRKMRESARNRAVAPRKCARPAQDWRGRQGEEPCLRRGRGVIYLSAVRRVGAMGVDFQGEQGGRFGHDHGERTENG